MPGLSGSCEDVDQFGEIVGRLWAQGPFQALVIEPHPGVTAVCPHPHGNGLAIVAERHGAGNDQHFAQKNAESAYSPTAPPQSNTLGPPLNVAV